MILVVLSYTFARVLAFILHQLDASATSTATRTVAFGAVQSVIYPTIVLLYAREETIADLQIIYPASDPGSGAGAILASGLLTCTILASSYARKFGFGGGDVVGSYDRLRAPGIGPERRVLLAFTAVVFTGSLVLEASVAGLVSLQPQWLAATLVVLVAIYLVAIHPVQPAWGQFVRATRPPTDHEQERVRRCDEANGVVTDRIVVFDGPSTSPGLLVTGRVLGRYVWIHESVLETANDENLATALALSHYRTDRYFYAVWLIAGLLGIAGAGFLATRTAVTGTFGVPILALTPFVSGMAIGYWYTNRVTRRAEELVGEQYGVERVIAAYENLGSFQTLADWSDLPLPRVLRQFHPDPPIAWRLERLAGESGAA